jgi:hypothetical protein
MKLLFNPNPNGLWRDIIHEAESNCRSKLQVELESYLINLLVRFSTQPELATQIMATQFLESVKLTPSERAVALQHVGDSCLIYSGLFPGIAEKRLVKISYFINLGRSAYSTISTTSNDLYDLLTKRFVAIMDLLQSLRAYSKHYPDLMPLQAYDLWNESGSQRALRTLRQYSNADPMRTLVRDEGTCIIRIKK